MSFLRSSTETVASVFAVSARCSWRPTSRISTTSITRAAHQRRCYSTPAKAAKPVKDAQPLPLSSCAADTVLPGLNYLKGQEPVLALPDENYPPWLWKVLEPRDLEPSPNDSPTVAIQKMKWKRRTENKNKIRERNFLETQ